MSDDIYILYFRDGMRPLQSIVRNGSTYHHSLPPLYVVIKIKIYYVKFLSIDVGVDTLMVSEEFYDSYMYK